MSSKNGTKSDEIVLNEMDEDEKGYPWRIRQWTLAQVKLTEATAPLEQLAAFDEVLDFILEFVAEPADKDVARELLAGPDGPSQKEFRDLGRTILGIDDPLALKKGQT